MNAGGADSGLSEDEYGIPKNLARRALRRLGRYREPVKELVRRTNRIRWMEHAGKEVNLGNEVVRVWSLEDAKAVKRPFLEISECVWKSIEEIGKVAARFEAMQAAEEYYIARADYTLDYPSWPHELLSPQIKSDIVGALREIILDDLVSIHFFREAIDWYERGHWLCAISSDGRRIVW